MSQTVNISMTQDKLNELVKIFNGNLDLMLFYVTWIKCGLNASKAYKELHPAVTDGSARELGSNMLNKINRQTIMQAYGLDQQLYFTQLKEALQATKWNDFTGEREADHQVRKGYHDKLGKLLGLEQEGQILQQFNISDDMTLNIVDKDGQTIT